MINIPPKIARLLHDSFGVISVLMREENSEFVLEPIVFYETLRMFSLLICSDRRVSVDENLIDCALTSYKKVCVKNATNRHVVTVLLQLLREQGILLAKKEKISLFVSPM